MLYIVDGTGADSDEEYDRDMANGFCSRMAWEFGGVYRRGPTTFDVSQRTSTIASEVFDKIIAARKDPKEPIYLAGHSRGGAAVIRVAEKLGERQIKVKALFLFDAVNRSLDVTFDDHIPPNVEMTYHARRDPSLASYYEADLEAAERAWRDCMRQTGWKYAGPLVDPSVLVYNVVFGDPAKELPQACAAHTAKIRALKELDQKMKFVMRTNLVFDLDLFKKYKFDSLSINFSNTGTLPAEPSSGRKVFSQRLFKGSHGAIGGAPITDDRAPPILRRYDARAILEVRTWMWANFAAENLQATERPRDPGSDMFA